MDQRLRHQRGLPLRGVGRRRLLPARAHAGRDAHLQPRQRVRRAGAHGGVEGPRLHPHRVHEGPLAKQGVLLQNWTRAAGRVGGVGQALHVPGSAVAGAGLAAARYRLRRHGKGGEGRIERVRQLPAGLAEHDGHAGEGPGQLRHRSSSTSATCPTPTVTSPSGTSLLHSGNHERTWTNSGGFFDGKDSGGECGVAAETYYYYPAENRANFWYKVDYGVFRFCIADSEHDWREGTPQYKFIEECLSTVDRKHQPWLIFAAHRVLGYSSNAWYALEGSFEEPEGRENLQKLWQKYRVDIAFFGHVHNYERTCPIYQSQCMTNEKSHYSGTMNGTIHVVAGGGGSHLSDYTPAIPKWSIFRDHDFGFVKLTAFNQSSLLFEYKKSSDGKVYDSFTIDRDYRDVLSCVHDSCFPTTLAS